MDVHWPRPFLPRKCRWVWMLKARPQQIVVGALRRLVVDPRQLQLLRLHLPQGESLQGGRSQGRPTFHGPEVWRLRGRSLTPRLTPGPAQGSATCPLGRPHGPKLGRHDAPKGFLKGGPQGPKTGPKRDPKGTKILTKFKENSNKIQA